MLEQYADDILKFSGEEVNTAWKSWRAQSGFAPKPGNLIPLMAKKLELQDRAQLMAQDLFFCVSFYSKHGTCWADVAEAWIRKVIGDIGWKVVEQLGGWKSIWNRSESLMKNPEMAIGSWRKMFDALLLSEEIDGPICLPTKEESKNVLKIVDVKMRQAGDYDKEI